MKRCDWAKSGDELMRAYHDTEWGVPSHEDRHLFEMLTLEGAQAGLSWKIILDKRQGYKKAFDNFNAKKIAKYSKVKIAALLKNPKIVRNRLKVGSVVTNAVAFLEIQKEFGSFDKYIWQFTGGKAKNNKLKSMKQLPASTPESDNMSKDLKKRGFRFVGSTICYSFMQATGMVNDHILTCDFK